ncbi:hypothetical protein BDR26DRAFT_7600 [Obelidium mucronatum]|nr:hypothetical protein BDR26DRAFT_7600 [Obelidium mucronatum]
MDFLLQMFPETSEQRIRSILGLAESDSTLEGMDVEAAVEIVLASLDDDDQYSDDGSQGQDGEEEPGIEMLRAIFPNVSAAVLSKVLSDCKGNVMEAAERISVHGSNAVNLPLSDADSKTFKSYGTELGQASLVGRDHDIDTLISMFPSLSMESAKDLLKSRGGLHNTIDFLTRSHSPTNDDRTSRKSQGVSYLSNTSYSKISRENEKEPGWEDVPTKMRFSTTTNVNPHIPNSTDSQTLEPNHIATTRIQEDDMDLSSLDAEFCRQQAHEYAMKRGEAFQCAAKEFKRGTLTGRGSAQYYSDIGHQHSIQVSLWNSRAAKCVLRANAIRHKHDPSVLDLHGLTKAEAICALTNKLDEYFKKRNGGATLAVQKPLQVITGLGIHSGNRKAVLLPVVLSFLKREGWRFEHNESNEGYIEVKGR